MISVILVLAGVLVIYGVSVMVNTPKPPEPMWSRMNCDSTSPDGVYRCTLHMAHNGWCENGNVEWRYEAWAIGSDDNTRAASPPILVAEPQQAVQQRTRIPRPVFWIGILLLAGTANFAYDTQHPKQPEQSWSCDWSATTCKNWQQK